MNKTTYLLGAGFTRAIVGNSALLADEILPKLNLSQYPEIIEVFEKCYPDIEQFITLLDLKIIQFEKTNKSIGKKFRKISNQIISQIIKLFGTDKISIDNLEDNPLLKDFISSIPSGSTILTLNYDVALDQGLYLSNRWHPKGGYLSGGEFGDENKDRDKILLLKLHGSINFFKNDHFHVNKRKNKDLYYTTIEISPKFFPKISSNLNINKGGAPDALMMSYVKKFNTFAYNFWDKAIEDLKQSDKLVVIGCSLRDEDTFLKFALRHFGEKDNTDKFKIYIVDPKRNMKNKIKYELIDQRLVGNPDKMKLIYSKTLQGFLNKDEKTVN